MYQGRLMIRLMLKIMHHLIYVLCYHNSNALKRVYQILIGSCRSSIINRSRLSGFAVQLPAQGTQDPTPIRPPQLTAGIGRKS